MRIRYVTLASGLALLFSASPAAAQAFCFPSDSSDFKESDIAACSAATTTPFGALPTNLPASWLGRTPTGVGFHVNFGSMDEEGAAGRRNLGVGVDFSAGRASVGITGGIVDYTCDGGEEVDCKRAFMVGARFATPLMSTALGAGGAAQSSFIIGLNMTAGFATGDVIDANFFGETVSIGGNGISVGLGLPIGVVARSGTVSITPFLEPAFFWGRTKFDVESSFGSDEESETGTGFALGGGVAFGMANGLTLNVGLKKVMLDEANALIGVGLSFQR